MVTVFSESARLAGPQLTRPGMAAAFQHLDIPLGMVQAGSFRPGKTDYSDSWRQERYDSSCKCYHPTGPSRRGPY
jgi:hypothetical protein